MARFPVFKVTDEADAQHLLIPYLYTVSQHCAAFMVYAPLPHTMRAGLPVGAWFDDLPLSTQRETTTIFDGLLAQVLRAKQSGLMDWPELLYIL